MVYGDFKPSSPFTSLPSARDFFFNVGKTDGGKGCGNVIFLNSYCLENFHIKGQHCHIGRL